jgi:hypothetical protein
MEKIIVKPLNLIDSTHLPEVVLDQKLTTGDPLEINGEMFYVCELPGRESTDSSVLPLIPLVVRNPANIPDIKEYIKCLSMAHRRVQFRNRQGVCDLESCDEMIIT